MSHIPALVALMFASTAAAAPLKSREEISAPPADDSTCYDAPSVTEAQKAAYKLVFVRSAMRWKDDKGCADYSYGEDLAIYEEVDGKYWPLKNVNFSDGTTHSRLFTARVTNDARPLPETLLVIELHYMGTGSSVDYYQLYRLGHSHDLQPVQIKSPETLLQNRLQDGQGIVGPGYDFTDDRIGFGMSIANRGESNRFPSGGSAFGTMKLVAASNGLELVPEPTSLQLPSESSRLNRLGLGAYREKRYDDAVEYYRQAIHWHSRNDEAKSNLGLAYFRLNKLPEAIETSTDVLQTADAPVSIRAASAFNLGQVYESVGERDRAAGFYETALRLQPSPARRDAVERLQGQNDTSQSTGRKDVQASKDGGQREPIDDWQVHSLKELPGFRLFGPPKSMRARDILDFAPDGEQGFWLATVPFGVIRR